jgi:hypothetical protein
MKDGRTLKEHLTDACSSIKQVFNTKVSATPARVTPMKLEVDETLWHDPANALGPRQHSPLKQAEVQKQIHKMLPLGVIAESQAPYYSQVHLTPKPKPGEWRFCIDYRRLNQAIKSMGWPLPNISEMLRRLGQRGAKFFCKLDLTAGYHQTPLHESSRKYTAFKTAFGVYQWLRVPMGLKGAPSYFQHILQSEVLGGLMYEICELYIDDVIIFADTEEEMVVNLRKVLERLHSKGITVSPDKCSFGLEEIEFVGHILNKEGLHFTRSKLDKVLNISLPQTAKQLKSFLGVCIFFSEHVHGYSDLTKPLHQLLTNYEPRRKLIWTPETEQAFYDTQKAVNECPQLFFTQDDLPVFVATDASDYGIGGICYQVTDNKILPISFMSKTLSAQECNWTTTEKECWAIVYAFKKFQYLIRDIHFTLLTDHKNLIYIDSETSQKVKRWKLAIQEYDFDIHHIPGRLNVIADAFSRLKDIPEELVHWMDENDAQTKVDASKFARGLAKLLNLDIETVLWLEEYHIPEEAEQDITRHHNDVVGHHGVQRTLERLTRERELAQRYLDNKDTRSETSSGISNRRSKRTASKAQKTASPDEAHGPIHINKLDREQLKSLTRPWPNMREHVSRYIKRCACCQKMSHLKVPITTHKYTVASAEPFMRINIDRIGPLPESEDGYNCILVIIDCFS